MVQHPNPPTSRLRRARPGSVDRLLGRLVGRRWLVAVCVGVTVVETLLVGAFPPASSVALATQVSAPPPFGVFHDLRWIVVYHESWFGLRGANCSRSLVFRSVLPTVCLRAAWPHDIAPEPVGGHHPAQRDLSP